jgi:phospholipase/carboxylesterase
VAQNEPWRTSALRKIEKTLRMVNDAGIPPERIVLGGFSQGACLATEFIATHPRRYAGLLAFTGDPDPHVPWQRVQNSAQILAAMGAAVTLVATRIALIRFPLKKSISRKD